MKKNIVIFIFCLASLIILLSASTVLAQESSREIQEIIFYPGSHVEIKYTDTSTTNIHLGDSFREVTNLLGLPTKKEKPLYYYIIKNKYNFTFAFNEKGEVIFIYGFLYNGETKTNKNVKLHDNPDVLKKVYGNGYIEDKSGNKDDYYIIEYEALGLGVINSPKNGIAAFYIFQPEN